MNIYLDNYDFSRNETLFSVLTLTGGKLAQRHWQMSSQIEDTASKWAHRVIAVIDSMPLLGGLCALIETIAVNLIIKSPGKRVNQRNSYIGPLNLIERNKYLNAMNNDCNTKENIEIVFNIRNRKANFSKNYRQVGLFKILEKPQSDKLFFDLREIKEEKDTNTKYYAPFVIVEYTDGNTFISNDFERPWNRGWLALQFNDEEKCICICRIDNFYYDFRGVSKDDGRTGGIGSALVQFAIEKSIKKGFGGKVTVNSSDGSGLFFYKLGFVCKEPEMQKSLEKCYLNNESIDAGEMYLPEDAIAAWKQKIEQNPIMV